MNVKKFFAKSSRDALRVIREKLGPDAVLLSNRAVEGGVEILALAGEEISQLADVVEAPPSEFVEEPSPRREASVLRRREGRETAPEPRAKPAARERAGAGEAPVQQAINRQLAEEIRMLRGMVEEQVAGLALSDMQKRDPIRARLLRQLLAAGFSPLLSRHLLEHLPGGLAAGEAEKWLTSVLMRNLPTPLAEEEIVNEGGVYALVGPTGVGKTTTTAKLAARAVVRFGAERVALLTTDGYRIGGHEQLRIYGKLLGIPVHGVKDVEDLNGALSDLRHKHLVLIDTVGMSQRDQAVAEQVALLGSPGANVKRLLLLNATSNADTLEDVIRAYRGNGIEGCIVTKTDEAVGLGTVLDAVIRHRLALHFIANGQRVPEDLHAGNRQYLIHRVFRQAAREPSPFVPNDGELGLLMAAQSRRAAIELDLAGVHLG